MPQLAILFALFAALSLAGPFRPVQSLQPPPPGNQAYLTGCGQAPNTNTIYNPPEIYSVNGTLSVTLNLTGSSDILQSVLCYQWRYDGPKGSELLTDPPTLHVKQGDRIVLTLQNSLHPPGNQPHSEWPAPALQIGRSALDAEEPHAATFLGPDGKPCSLDDLERAIRELAVKPRTAKNNAMLAAYRGALAAAMNQMAEQMNHDHGKLPCGQRQIGSVPTPDPVTGRIYGYHRPPYNETNLHFHGLNTSPKAPSDDVVSVLLCPSALQGSVNQYTYIVDIPANEPPGTYWYHPHPHGESDRQLLAGLTGVIIVDTVQKSLPDTLPAKMIVIRDQGKAGEARPRWGMSHAPTQARVQWAEQQFKDYNYYHRPGGYPFGPPDQCPGYTGTAYDAKSLTVNHVPLPPTPTGIYGLPQTTIESGVTDYYRFANTSSDTILDVVETVNGADVPLQVSSRDSVPLVQQNGQPTWQPVAFDHIFVPPASRFEFYLTGTKPGDQILFTTLTIDSGCWGDVTLQRNLFVVNVVARKHDRVVRQRIPPALNPTKLRFTDLYKAKPVAHRYFAFTEYNAQGDFYITEISNPKAVERPYTMGGPAQVTVKAGTVEDWTILNYAQETHMFHIHQIHFLVLKAQDYEFGLGQMLDMVNVPYGVFKKPGDTSGNDMIPGAVTLRMDFRDKDIIGEFPFHCHILAHEDGGMMAKVRVIP